MRFVVTLPKILLDSIAKARSGLVRKQVWVKESNGRKGHRRMVWIRPGNYHGDEKNEQLLLFNQTEPSRTNSTDGKVKKYYVSIIRDDKKRGLLAGPYDTREEALLNVKEAKRLAQEVDPWAAFDAFGTASYEAEEGKHPTGKLNDMMTSYKAKEESIFDSPNRASRVG